MPSAFPHRVVYAESWKHVKEIFARFPYNWVFRGQRDQSWPLSTSLERRIGPEYSVEDAEQPLRRRFERGAYSYLSQALIPSDRVGWLTLMQHHGAPTRLLDWTLSPYVAAFFAVEQADTDSAIWVLALKALEDAIDTVLKGFTLDYGRFDNVTDPEYHRLLFDWKPTGVFAVESLHHPERVQIQRGLFLMGGNPALSFENNLSKMPDFDTLNTVLKIVIPLAAKTDALVDLLQMNVTWASLFPGLDGYAQSFIARASLLVDPRVREIQTLTPTVLPPDLGAPFEPVKPSEPYEPLKPSDYL